MEILVLIIMAVAAIRSALALRKGKALFTEFGASQALIPLICLFPVGLLVFLVLSRALGLLPAGVIAIACFVPAVVSLKKARYVFERSGTDRTREIQDALGIVFITGVGGIVYVIATIAISLLFSIGSVQP